MIILLFGIGSDMDNSSINFLALGTKTKNIVKIPLEKLKIKNWKLLQIINSMKNIA